MKFSSCFYILSFSFLSVGSLSNRLYVAKAASDKDELEARSIQVKVSLGSNSVSKTHDITTTSILIAPIQIVFSGIHGLIDSAKNFLLWVFKAVRNIVDRPSYSSENSPSPQDVESDKQGHVVFDRKVVTNTEATLIRSLRERIASINQDERDSLSPWLYNCSDIDILRFLRAKNGNIDKSFKMIIEHAKWRLGPDGADTLLRDNAVTVDGKTFNFTTSKLNEEFFWLGIDKLDCVTVVGRVFIHDGADYDENPIVFTSFVVWMLEKGRLDYSAGSQRQVCVILDRAKVKEVNKIESFDLRIIPSISNLVLHLTTCIKDNYPEIFSNSKIVPTSWFFSMCYNILSKFLDSKIREKLQMVTPDRVARVMHTIFDSTKLPPHLGGNCTEYGPPVTPTDPTQVKSWTRSLVKR